jgi:NarL family two-component system response regulator LiaR
MAETTEATAQTPVRVVLVDDHAVVREGLRALLEREHDITVVGEAGTGREAVTAVLALVPDVVVMDFALPDISGVEACRQIRDQAPGVRVLFLSMHEEEAYFVHALQAGAVGYLVKRSAASDIRAAVLGTARGEVYLAPTLATVLVRHVTGQPPPSANEEAPSPLMRLSPREREVLQLVASGLTNQAIAHQLGISIKTVQAHREHIMDKLGLRDITQLVRFAIRYGVISDAP